MTENNISIAIKAEVPFGERVIEGYLLPSKLWTELNKFGVSKTQAVLLAYPDFDRNYGASKYTEIVKSKKAQTLIPLGIQVHRKIKVQNAKEKVDLISLDQLIPFLKICKKLGSTKADELIDDLAGLSLQQIFSDAFKIKFEEEDRQLYLTQRQHHREHFHPNLTKWLKHDAGGDSKEVYWGKEVNDFKQACNLPLSCVDTWDTSLLQILNHAETSYNSLRLAGLSHNKAMTIIRMQH